MTSDERSFRGLRVGFHGGGGLRDLRGLRVRFNRGRDCRATLRGGVLRQSLRGEEALDSTVRAWRTDPRVWFVLLESPDATPRTEELAINQIKRLLEEEVVWEFQADETVRRQNLEALRKQVGL